MSGGLRELARVPVSSAHHVYDVVSDGRAVVWDQGDNAASEAIGGRVLKWKALQKTGSDTVATATGTQIINDAVVFGDEVFYRIITPTNGTCGGEPESCFSWSLWRRTMPSGIAIPIAHGAPADRTLLPELAAVGTRGVAYQRPALHRHVTIFFVPLGGSPAEMADNAVPGSLVADDRYLYTQVAATHDCCQVARLDPGHPGISKMQTSVPEPATKFYSIFEQSRAAIAVEDGKLVLHVTTASGSSTRTIDSDVYDMFWINADHLLVYRADGLFVYIPADHQAVGIAAANAFDIGAAVHSDDSVLTFAVPAGSPSTIEVWVPKG